MPQTPNTTFPASSDFNDIRQKIIDYLKQKPEFSDYNFEGSALSTLIDILAYVAHYFSIQANMVFSERFLDSAVIRDNIVSIAQELGYFPSMGNAAEASVDIFIPQNVVQGYSNMNYFAIPKGTQFVGNDEFGNSVQFIVAQDTDLLKGIDPNTFNAGFFGNVVLLQGQEEYYSQNYQDQSTEFFIDANGIDAKTIEVRIKPPTGKEVVMKNANESFGLPTTIQKSSYFYFMRQVSGKLHIYFSDGTIGLQPPVNSTISVRFIRCDGAKGNGCGNFSLVNPVQYTDPSNNTIQSISSQDVVIYTKQVSFGGEDAETPNRIRTFAPLVYQSQNRAITTDDYKGILAQRFPWIADISAWGGEDNNPPQYGYVFLSIKPRNNTLIPPTLKHEIVNFLKTKKAIGVIPKIVDPEFIYINVSSKIFVQNSILANQSTYNAKTAIKDFVATISEKFNQTFYYSKLLKAIDDSDTNITGNETSITISKIFDSGQNNFLQISEINFGTPIVSLAKTQWQDEQLRLYEISDDGNGNLLLSINGVQADTIGNIDYNTGKITINNYTINIKPQTTMEFNAIPREHTIALANSMMFQPGNISVVA